MPPPGDGSSPRIWPQQSSSQQPTPSSAAPSVQQTSPSSIARSPSSSPRLTSFNPTLPNSLRARGSTNSHRQKALSVSGLLSVPELTPAQQVSAAPSIYKVPAFASSSIDVRSVNHHTDPSFVHERPLLAPFKAFQQPTNKVTSNPNNSYFDLSHVTTSNGVVGGAATSPNLEVGSRFSSTNMKSPSSKPPILPHSSSLAQFSRIQSSPSLVLDDEMKRGMMPGLRRLPGPSNLVYGNGNVSSSNKGSRVVSSLSPQIPDILISNDTDSDTTSNGSGSSTRLPAKNGNILLSDKNARRHSSFTGSSNVSILPEEWFRGERTGSIGGGAPVDSKGNISMIQSVEELQKSLGGDVVVKLDAVEEILKARMTSFEQHLAGIRSLRNRSNEVLATFKAHASQSHSDFNLYAQKYKELDFSEFDDLEKRVVTARDKVDEYSQRLKIVNDRISVQERDNHTRQLRYKFIRRSLASICLFFFLLVILFKNLGLKDSVMSYYSWAFSSKSSSNHMSAVAAASPPDDFTNVLESLDHMDLKPIVTILDKTYL